MFTGIIEKTGKILEIQTKSGAKRFKIQYSSEEALADGESINVNGACQTVINTTAGDFWVEAMTETLRRTNLDRLKIGDEVNLERSLKLSDRISGHLVTGHVDTVGEISHLTKNPDSWLLKINFPGEFSRYAAPKGSMAVNGISLTVIDINANAFTVGIIPYTWQNTNLKNVEVGEVVNLEFDLVAKYIESVLGNKTEKERLTLERLQQAGWSAAHLK
jgi:riboflavin synthase